MPRTLKRLMQPVVKDFAGSASLADQRQVKVICSTAETDRMGDVVVQNGIDLSAYKTNPVVLWQHDADHPIARAVDIGIDNNKLCATVQFPEEGTSTLSDEVYGLIKAGVVNATSIGFMVLDSEPLDNKRPYSGQRFKKSELMEFSFVSVPANRGCIVQERSAPLAAIIEQKGLYTVSQFAYVLQSLFSIYSATKRETANEGDESSVPGMIEEALVLLSKAFVAMAEEETAEELAGDDKDDLYDGCYLTGPAAVIRLMGRARALIKQSEIERAGRVLSGDNEKSLRDAHDMITEACDMIRSVCDKVAPPAEDADAASTLESDATDPEAEEKAVRQRKAAALKRKHQHDSVELPQAPVPDTPIRTH